MHLPSTTNVGAAIVLRAAQIDDEPFLYQLYASTRAHEMTLAGWDEAQAASLLQMQYRAQTLAYGTQFRYATTQIVLQNGIAIGRLICDRTDDEILLVDIALLPAYRNGGIGTFLVLALQTEAIRGRRAVRIHVHANNPAQHLYKRLGFVVTGEDGIHLEMRWVPPTESVSGSER